MLLSGSDSPEFSRWRSYLWPIHNHELKKLIPMLVIFFLISFSYNILHTMKDALVVTAKGSGAEAIPFIKVWGMFPGAILMTLLYTRLSNRFSKEVVSYTILSIFLIYFTLFAFVLYPARNSLHPNDLADNLQSILPIGFKGVIAMFRNWTFTSFYIMSELWSNIILALIFWGFANQITRLNEAKRFYGLFGIGTNISGVVAGNMTAYFSRHVYNPNLPFGDDAWGQSIAILLTLVVLAGVLAQALFYWMNRVVLSDPLYYDATSAVQEKKMKGKLSLRDSFRYLARSKYLICIATIVISYNLVINLVEVLWKSEVKELYPSPNDYNAYMGGVKIWIGALATFASLLISGNSVRKFGWTFTAFLTPGILLLTSVGFFGFFFIKDQPIPATAFFQGMTPLALVVFFGSAQNVLSRAAKYTVFDATKEMAFVPLSAECKLKGKAAIDGICSRFGKSGGSLIHGSLLVSFASFAESAPYVAAILFAVILVWAGAIRVLGRKFGEITAPEQKVLNPAPEADLAEQRA